MKTYWHRRANISIGTVTTLPAGSDATASVDEDNVLSLGIPQGEQGEPGPKMTYSDLEPEDKAALASDVADAVVGDLPYASTDTYGVVKVGTGLAIDANGKLAWNGGSDTPQMSGANASTDGSGGTVPAPLRGDNTKFLRGDATWASTPYPGNATTGAAGLMSASDKSKLDGIAAQATKGAKTLLWSSNVAEADTYLAYFNGDVLNYDFVIVKFLCRYGYDPFKFQVFVPEDLGSNYRIKSCLQYCGFSSNKNGSRSFTASVGSGQTSFVFDKGYFDGSTNKQVCLPRAIWGVKL